MASCRAGSGVVFSETARCDASFDTGNFIDFGAVRCCCAESDFPAATQAERDALCRPACDKDPYPSVPECEMFGGRCEERCSGATRGLTSECASCIAAAVSFSWSSCGARECVCGGASFPSMWSTCAVECASSRQHERELYAAKPRPAPVGRSPALLIDAPDKLMPMEMAVDAAGRVWVAAASRTADSTLRFSVAQLEPSLELRWRWDDPASRVISGTPSIVRLGDQIVVSAALGEHGEGTLLFFDSAGFVREVATSLMFDKGLAALGPDLLLREQPAGATAPSLVIIDAQGLERFRAPEATLADFNTSWIHAARAPAGWTLISHLDSGGLQWRRVSVDLAATPPSAAIAWTHRLDGNAWQSSPRAAVAVAGDDVLVWGTRSERRGNIGSSFPWLAQLGADGRGRWQWSNGQLATPGEVHEALQTPSGETCALGDESWEHSTADPPTGGARCSPEGCEALTLRCFDRDGNELWKYHHRSDYSGAIALAAADGGRPLYVAGTIHGDANRSTGTRWVLMKFE